MSSPKTGKRELGQHHGLCMAEKGKIKIKKGVLTIVGDSLILSQRINL